jgi:hypothetical protein
MTVTRSFDNTRSQKYIRLQTQHVRNKVQGCGEDEPTKSPLEMRDVATKGGCSIFHRPSQTAFFFLWVFTLSLRFVSYYIWVFRTRKNSTGLQHAAWAMRRKNTSICWSRKMRKDSLKDPPQTDELRILASPLYGEGRSSGWDLSHG